MDILSKFLQKLKAIGGQAVKFCGIEKFLSVADTFLELDLDPQGHGLLMDYSMLKCSRVIFSRKGPQMCFKTLVLINFP